MNLDRDTALNFYEAPGRRDAAARRMIQRPTTGTAGRGS